MKKKTVGTIITLLVLISGLIFYGYSQIQKFAATPLGLSHITLFKLPQGVGRVALEALLLRDRLITRSGYLFWLLQLMPELANFKAGTYQLDPGMTVRDLLMLFNSGKEKQFSVRFLEGSYFSDWLEKMAHLPYLQHQLLNKDRVQIAALLGIHPSSMLEGSLYPDTYYYIAGTSDITLLKRAYQRMNNEIAAIWTTRDKDLPYQSPQEMITMASIIEKETAVASERAIVASVFINRLRLGMRLQTDPTVIYGLGKSYRGDLTRQDLKDPNPYNTYLNAGLPPTPIAMPSKAALEAAAHPAKTTYLYFVADGRGGHVFSHNLQNHNKAVRNYRQVLKEQHEK